MKTIAILLAALLAACSQRDPDVMSIEQFTVAVRQCERQGGYPLVAYEHGNPLRIYEVNCTPKQEVNF